MVATREALKVTPPGEITFKQVSRLAGIDNRLIRYYFGYMPDLLRAVAIQVTEELRNRFVTANLHTGSVRDNLRLRVSIFLDFFGSNPHYHRLVVDYLLNTEGPHRLAALERIRLSIAELAKCLDKTSPNEGYSLDATLVHTSMAALCEFLFSAKPVFEALFDADADSPQFKDRYCDFVTNLIVGTLTCKGTSASLKSTA